MKAQHTSTTTSISEANYQNILNQLIENNPSFVHLDLSKLHLTEKQLTELAIKIQNNNFVGNVSWGNKPSNSDELVDKIESKIILNNQNYKHHPNDYIHGLLSSHAYVNSKENVPVIFTTEEEEKKCREQIEIWRKESDSKMVEYYDSIRSNRQINKNEESRIKKEQKKLLDSKITKQNEELEKYKKHIESWNEHLKGWEVDKVFSSNEADKYYSAVYINKQTGQVVLAHRGTDFTQILSDLPQPDCSLKTDLAGVLGGKIVPQIIKAHEATKYATDHAKSKAYNLSITGHSLGAWLAELSIYFCHRDFEYHKAKTVTFDSPGSVIHMKNFASNIINPETEFNIKDLDITTYLSAPNFVNSCNQHVGKVYRLSPQIDIAEIVTNIMNKLKNIPILGSNIDNDSPLYKGFASIFGHSLTPLIAEFNPKTGKPTNYEKVLDWPVIRYIPREQVQHESNIISTALGNVTTLFISQEGKAVMDCISDSTFMSLVTLLKEALQDKIGQQQYIECFKYLEDNSNRAFPPKKELHSSEKFSLLYEGRYRVASVNLKEDVLSTAIGSIDWYLNHLNKYSSEELKEIAGLNDENKQQLIELKNKFKIDVGWNKKHLRINDSVYMEKELIIDDIRDQLATLIKVLQIKEVLEKSRPNSNNLSKVKLINYLAYERVEKFTARESVLADIERTLTNNKSVAIIAFPGTGKSSCALEYAYKKKEAKGIENKKIVRWFNADSPEKIITEYNQLATELEVDIKQPQEMIIRLVNNRLNEVGYPVLFIFDNVEDYSHISNYLLNIPQGVRVVITSRNSNLSDKMPIVPLEPFNKEEAKKYLNDSLPNRLNDDDVETLIKKAGLTPFKLEKVVAYLKNNEFITVAKYLEEIAAYVDKKSNQPETEMLLKLAQGNQSPAWHILQYAAKLDADFISIEIFKKIFMIDDIQLGEYINPLKSLSLVTVIHKSGEHGLKLHRIIQEEIQKYVNRPANIEHVLLEKVIFDTLLTSLNDLMPAIEEHKNDEWKTAELFYIQAGKILIENKASIKKENEASLYNKLGLYYHHVLCNFKQALDYFEKALTIRKELYKGQNHPDLAESLYNICFGYKDTGNDKKWLESAELSLKMRQELYQNNHSYTANSLNIIGFAHFRLGNSKESLTYLEKALKMRQALYQGNHPDIANSLISISNTYGKLGDAHKDKELTIQAYFMRVQTLGLDHPDTQSLKIYLEKNALEFIKNNEAREFILHRGSLDENIMLIKQAIQNKFLNKIQLTQEEKFWSTPHFQLNPSILKSPQIHKNIFETKLWQYLGDLATPKNLEIAKMLYFEAINLRILAMTGEKNYSCAIAFAKKYPELINKIALEHPEYFVDGSIVRQCVSDGAILNRLLGDSLTSINVENDISGTQDDNIVAHTHNLQDKNNNNETDNIKHLGEDANFPSDA